MKGILKLAMFSMLVSSAAFAQGYQKQNGENAKKSEIREKRKAEIISLIDLRVQNLNRLKSCISSASSGEEVKKCRQTSLQMNKQINTKAQKSFNRVSGQQEKMQNFRNQRGN